MGEWGFETQEEQVGQGTELKPLPPSLPLEAEPGSMPLMFDPGHLSF